MKNENITFCVPVRGGSKRIPRKNMLVLDGETLIARKIRQCLPLGTVVVGSDDDEMLIEAERHGAVAVRRSRTNEGQDCAQDMIAEMMELIEPLEPETVVWAHCTNPFIDTKTYAEAIETFHKGLQEGYDSLVSVHEIHGHYWNADGEPMYPLDKCRVRHICAGDLSPMYEQTGGVFIQPYWRMRDNHYFFGSNPKLFVTDDVESFDLNTPNDWLVCQALHQKRRA